MTGNERLLMFDICNLLKVKPQKNFKTFKDRYYEEYLQVYRKKHNIDIAKSEINIDDRKCVICGKEFTPKAVSQKYCCDKCKGEGLRRVKEQYKKRLAIKKCPICNKKFKPNTSTQKYCSVECRAKSMQIKYREKYALIKRNKKIIKVCPICGKEFEAKTDREKYCSDGCRKIMYVEYKKRAKEKQSKPIEFTKCKCCGKEFIKKKNKKYCSVACRNKDAYYKEKQNKKGKGNGRKKEVKVRNRWSLSQYE